MKKLFLSLIAMLGIALCANAENVTKNYKVSGFESISASHAFNVEVSQGSKYAVQLDIPESYVDYLVVEKRGSTLIIGLKNTLPKRLQNLKETCRAFITMPELNGIYLSGASKINVVDPVSISMGKMDIELSGASSILNLNVKAPEVEIEICGASHADITAKAGKIEGDLSGASRLTLLGNADELKIEVCGASGVNAKNLQATNVDVECSGASKAVVYAEKVLDVELSGASRCEYYGPEDLRLKVDDITGASRLSRAK